MSLVEPSPTLLSDADFERFQDFFYRKTGIRFGANRRYFVDKRILDRIRATGAPDFRTWFTTMRFEASGTELQALINTLTINETYFFRENYQFECLLKSVLPDLNEQRRGSLQRPIRIWVVPSATGEEAYSIAIKLIEEWPQLEDIDVEIIASDIDTRVLHRAQVGEFSARSVQYVPENWLHKHFRSVEGGKWQITDDLRSSVDFRLANLTALPAGAYRDFDIVFCRNLLIYFDDASRRAAVESIYAAMRPGGYVFLGHSESMSRITSLFDVRKFAESLVYQKPGVAR